MTFGRVNISDLRSKQESEALSRNKQRKAVNMRVNATRIRNPRGVMGGCSSGVAIEKERALQSPAYERAAKSLGYCMRCNCQVVPLTGALDFCHRDMGKGQGIKTDSREGWPGCRTCHEIVGRELPRAVRRAVEILLGVMTRAAVRAAGTWPKKLPEWKEPT